MIELLRGGQGSRRISFGTGEDRQLEGDTAPLILELLAGDFCALGEQEQSPRTLRRFARHLEQRVHQQNHFVALTRDVHRASVNHELCVWSLRRKLKRREASVEHQLVILQIDSDRLEFSQVNQALRQR